MKSNQLIFFILLIFVKSLALESDVLAKNDIIYNQLILKTDKKAIEKLTQLIRSNKDPRIKPDLNFRLAELYLKQSKTLKQQNQILSLTHQINSDLNYTKEQMKYVQQSIDIYLDIIKNNPNYEQIDFVYFNLAFAYQLVNKIEESKNYYFKLISKFPLSTRISDSLFILANIYFDQKNYISAIQFYQKIQVVENSNIYQYAQFKLSWALFNLKRNEEAITTLLNLKKSSKEQKYVSINDIDKAMALFISDLKDNDYVTNVLKESLQQESESNLVKFLADIYYEHGRYDQLKKLNHWAESNVIQNELQLDIQLNLIKHYYHSQNYKDLYILAQNFLSLLQKMYLQKQLINERLVQFELILNSQAELWEKNKDIGMTNENTEKLLTIYRNSLPKEIINIQVLRLLAQVKFQMKKYNESRDLFRECAILEVNNQEKFELLLQSVLAAKLIYLENKKEFEQYLQSTKFALDQTKESEKINDLNLEIALIYFDKAQYKDALTFLDKIKQTHNVDLTNSVIDLKCQIYEINHQWKELKSFIHSKLANNTIQLKNKNALVNLKEKAEFEATMENLQALSEPEKELQYNQLLTSMNSIEYKKIIYIKLSDLYLKNKLKRKAIKSMMELLKLNSLPEEQTKALIDTIYLLAKQAGQTETILQLQKHTKYLNTQNRIEIHFLLYRFDSHLEELVKLKNIDYISQINSINKNQEIQNQLTKLIKDAKLEPLITQLEIKELESHFKNHTLPNDKIFQATKKIYSKSSRNEDRFKLRLIQAQILEEEYLQQSTISKAEKRQIVLNMKLEKFEKTTNAYFDAKLLTSSRIELNKIDLRFVHLQNNLIEKLERFEHQNEETRQIISQLKSQNPSVTDLNEVDRFEIDFINKGRQLTSQYIKMFDNPEYDQDKVMKMSSKQIELFLYDHENEVDIVNFNFILALKAYQEDDLMRALMLIQANDSNHMNDHLKTLYALIQYELGNFEIGRNLIVELINNKSKSLQFYFDPSSKKSSLSMNH